MSAPDRGIPEEVLEHAKCIAVVPHMLKGGFVFGAENGRGVATCRTENGSGRSFQLIAIEQCARVSASQLQKNRLAADRGLGTAWQHGGQATPQSHISRDPAKASDQNTFNR